ncbi:unnamed protein product, partial [Closterium sp. NIES-65]
MASEDCSTRSESNISTKDGKSRLRFDESVTVIYGTGETEIETLHVPEDSSSSASGAEPRETASSQSDGALRDEADGSSESHGQQAAAAFGMRHGEAEGDDLAEDFDYLDLEDLEQTWPERRESILGTRCGSPKGATEIGIMRSDAISRAWQGGVAGGPAQPVLFKLECLLLCSLHASAVAGAGAAHMALLCCALYIVRDIESVVHALWLLCMLCGVVWDPCGCHERHDPQ